MRIIKYYVYCIRFIVCFVLPPPPHTEYMRANRVLTSSYGALWPTHEWKSFLVVNGIFACSVFSSFELTIFGCDYLVVFFRCREKHYCCIYEWKEDFYMSFFQSYKRQVGVRRSTYTLFNFPCRWFKKSYIKSANPSYFSIQFIPVNLAYNSNSHQTMQQS